MRQAYTTQTVPKELRELAQEQIKKASAASKPAADITELKPYKAHKSCPDCGKVFSLKDGIYFCAQHPHQTRTQSAVETEARLLQFVKEGVLNAGYVGIRIYSTAPLSGEKIAIQQSYYDDEIKHPEKGGSLLVRLARYQIGLAGHEPNSLFTLDNHKLVEKGKLPRLTDSADMFQAASTLATAIESAAQGQYLQNRSILIKLIGEDEVVESILNSGLDDRLKHEA